MGCPRACAEHRNSAMLHLIGFGSYYIQVFDISLSLDKLKCMSKTATKQKNIVGLKDLRENMEKYIKRVRKGESLTVFRRSEPVFRITPVDADDEAGWEMVIDFTEINPNGVPAEDVLRALRRMHG